MHKRARNHKVKTDFEKGYDFTLEMLVDDDYKKSPDYEPQGKREARKYVKGLLYYKPSNFNKLYF